MKTIDPRYYDVIVTPVVTEKATLASEHNKVLFRVAAKAKDGGIVIIEDAKFAESKTKTLKSRFSKLGLANALIIDGAEIDNGFRLATRNIPNIDVLPIQGINVYDILRRNTLVLTRAALDALEARLK